MRLFVAVYPSDEALEHFAGAVAGLRLGAAAATGAKVGLTDRPRWHLTLAFLGDVPEGRRPDAESAVVSGVAAFRAAHPTPPRVRLAGGGRFGRGRFTVLWVGLAGDTEAFTALGRAVRRALRRHKLSFDGKPLRPHLTLARPGGRVSEADLAADREALDGYEGPAWTVGGVYLVRSHLGPRPAHEQLVYAPFT